MQDRIKSYWYYGTTFCSVEITSIGGVDTFFSITAKKKNNEFEDFDFIKSNSFTELSKNIAKHQHCYLIINTDKVLIKEIAFEKDNSKAVSNAFPSLSLQDFYYEILSTDSKSFIAICRKDYVERLIYEAESEKIEVIGFQLGFTSLHKIVSLLNEEELTTSRFKFRSSNNQIDGFNQNDNLSTENYLIEEIEVPSEYLISLSGLFNYVSKGNEANNIKEETHSLKRAQEQKNFFRKGLIVGIGILLFSLLLNFLFFNSYYKKLQSKQEEVHLLKSQKETFSIKSQELEQKEKIVENVLNSTQSKSSYYINRLVAEIPSSILFTYIEYQPLEKAIRADKEIEYKNGEIVINGESNDEPSFTSWIETVEKLDWTKNVTIINYGYSNKNNSEFSISIQF